MGSRFLIAVAVLTVTTYAGAQEQDPVHITPRVPEKIHNQKGKPSVTADTEEKAGPITPGESSSRETKINLAAPKNEASAYPESAESDVSEVHNWDPHRAQKDIEVGDYYAKRGNYRGALGRYESAIAFQDNNAEAMWKAAQTAEKMGQQDKALRHYNEYLRTLPRGDHAADAQRAVQRLSH